MQNTCIQLVQISCLQTFAHRWSKSPTPSSSQYQVMPYTNITKDVKNQSTTRLYIIYTVSNLRAFARARGLVRACAYALWEIYKMRGCRPVLWLFTPLRRAMAPSQGEWEIRNVSQAKLYSRNDVCCPGGSTVAHACEDYELKLYNSLTRRKVSRWTQVLDM